MVNVFMEHVVPSFGNCLATAMLLSPFPAVMRLRKSGKLGDINPLPYPLTSVNAMGWVAYGLASGNPYLFPANVVALLAGLFFSLTAYEVAPRKLKDYMAAILVGAAGHFVTLSIIGLYALSREGAQTLWGINAIVILMCYYLIPLSTLWVVVRTRNAVSIYPPLAVAALANGSMWTAYGFAVSDLNIWIPNLFGAIIAVVQLALRAVFGARSTAAAGAASGPGAAADAAHGAEAGHPAKGGGPEHVGGGRHESSQYLLRPLGGGRQAEHEEHGHGSVYVVGDGAGAHIEGGYGGPEGAGATAPGGVGTARRANSGGVPK